MYLKKIAEKTKVKPKKTAEVLQLSEPRFSVKIGTRQFFVPVLSGVRCGVRSGLILDKLKFNSAGIMIYEGKGTEKFIDQIENIYKRKGLLNLIFPTYEQAVKLQQNQEFCSALLAAGITAIPYIFYKDHNLEHKNVALRELLADRLRHQEHRQQSYQFCILYLTPECGRTLKKEPRDPLKSLKSTAVLVGFVDKKTRRA